MSIRLGTVLLVAALACGTVGGAWGAGLKVGFVNAPKLLELAPQSEAALRKLEKEFAPRDRKMCSSRGISNIH